MMSRPSSPAHDVGLVLIRMVWGVLSCLPFSACALFQPSPSPSSIERMCKEPLAVGNQALAGMWEYKGSNIVYLLNLDQCGNGTYKWQNGEFETTGFSDGRWIGVWRQKGNNREGQFEAELSKDHHSALGKWWYTRIGADRHPVQPGGTFVLTRREKESQNESENISAVTPSHVAD